MCKINAAEALQDIPVLTEVYLRSLTFGIYQLKQALSYSSEHVSDDGGYEIFVGKNNPDILQAKIQSRHVSSKSYNIWIRYDSADTGDPVKYWYCQCRSGARLVGCCVHAPSVLHWYIRTRITLNKQNNSK